MRQRLFNRLPRRAFGRAINRPPEGLSRSPADGEGAGAPIIEARVKPAPASVPSGAPAPDPRRLTEGETVAAYIFQNARAF